MLEVYLVWEMLDCWSWSQGKECRRSWLDVSRL